MNRSLDLTDATLGRYQAPIGQGGMGCCRRRPIWVPRDGSAATGLGIFQWARDGNGVHCTTAERVNVWLYRFGASAQTKVTNFSDAMIFNGAISRDGRMMLDTRGVQARDAF